RLRAVDDVLVRDDVTGTVVDKAGSLGLLGLAAREAGRARRRDGDLHDPAIGELVDAADGERLARAHRSLDGLRDRDRTDLGGGDRVVAIEKRVRARADSRSREERCGDNGRCLRGRAHRHQYSMPRKGSSKTRLRLRYTKSTAP